jgi:hypothetical protein
MWLSKIHDNLHGLSIPKRAQGGIGKTVVSTIEPALSRCPERACAMMAHQAMTVATVLDDP